MSELARIPPPPRAALLRQLRSRLAELIPGLRIVAEALLGAEATIDFVGIEPTGRTVLVFVGDAGGDLELVGRALAQRDWVEPRLRDWLQLAPGLPIRPEAGARAVLLCPELGSETRAAARALGPDRVWLARYHCIRNGAGIETLIEDVSGAFPSAPRAPAPDEARREPAVAPPRFRTGLSDADLGLTPDERREFE